ncbi:hypothetical protein M434DRAFT_378175 [Hypoxylon sp. CO27-5]|nr:hypothetical protein M434DRAFT_378175 [Hypoxylon sp. CO27-5]
MPLAPRPEGLSKNAIILIAVSWIFTSFAIVVVTLRVYLQQKFRRSIEWDDWIMVLALLCQIIFEVFLTLDCHAGLGHPIATMTMVDILNLTKWSWSTTPGSILAGTIARISVAMVFLHVFGNRNWFKRLMIYYTALLTVVGALNFIFVWVQAKPVQALWDPRIPACLAVFTLSDFIYTISPIIFISRLNMTHQKKIGLILLMSGFVVTMTIAIGRCVVVYLSLFQTTNPNADETFVFFFVGSLLASLEQCLVIIIGSIPKLKVAKKLKFPSLQSSFKGLVNRLRYGQSTAASGSYTNTNWEHSDVELYPSSRRSHKNFNSVPGGHFNKTSIHNISQETYEPGIHVTC